MTTLPTTPYALVVGESLVDVVTDAHGVATERPGGSAANVAVALARLGRRVRFATAFADDARGRTIADHLESAGVELATDPHQIERTSTAQATLAADGSASYVFDIDWRLGAMSDETPRFVHVCSIGSVLSPGAEDVARIVAGLAATSTISFDLNARPSITGTGADVLARVEALVRNAHLVKASDEDLETLYPHLGVEAAASHLLGLGAGCVVVTRGAEGLTWLSQEQRLDVPSAPSRLVDTIGAGDTVSAALIDALWQDATPLEALRHAAAAAAITVSRPGADPPRRHELRSDLTERETHAR
ncbi:carbohydrate kinase [soil metagenome]